MIIKATRDLPPEVTEGLHAGRKIAAVAYGVYRFLS